MIQLALIVAAATLGIGLVVALLLRLLPTVRLQLVPTAAVSVCLVNAAGKVLIGNLILQPGEPSDTFRSKRFRMVLGNNGLQMKIDGRTRSVPPSSEPIAYEVTSKNGRRPLAGDKRPTCLPS